MTLREKYLRQFTDNMLAAIDLTRKKNQDYAGEGDPFMNFRRSAEAAGVTVEQGIMVRTADKDTRIQNLLQRPGMKGAVADEKITDTLMDRMVYTCILLTWLQLERPEPDADYIDAEPIVEGNAIGKYTVANDLTTVPDNWWARVFGPKV